MTTSTQSNPPPALLTLAMIRQHYLPLPPRTLFRMISSGKFPKAEVVIGGKIRLWKRETVAAWISSNGMGGITSRESSGVKKMEAQWQAFSSGDGG